MKAMKILLKAVVCIVVLVVVALLALPLWFGPVVKSAANAAVPRVVKTDFHMGQLSLNPYTARFELGDMQLANPQGYSEKYAVTLGGIVFDAEALSLATDVIHIEEITVKDVFVSVVSGGENKVGNFKQIQYNVAGGKEKYEAAEAAKKAEAEKAGEAKKADGKQQVAEEEKPAKKVIIDKLHIEGLKVKLGIIPLSVPVAIELTDIGRKSGGATFEEAWQSIWSGILKSAGAMGDQLKNLGNLTGDAAKQATEAVGKVTEGATKAVGNAAEGATKAASQATKAVGNVAGDATKAVGNVAGDATKAVGNAAAGATKAVGNAAEGAAKAASGATKAAGEAAGKALDSIKNLW